MRFRKELVGVVLLAGGTAIGGTHPPLAARASVVNARSGAIAWVDFAHKTFMVRPPSGADHPAAANAPLPINSTLQTGAGQIGSIRYADDVRQRFNANTVAVLSSPSLLIVKQGEVAPIGASSTRHRIETPSGVVQTIGTEYDVRVNGIISTFTVRQGALDVSNQFGSVHLIRNQQTVVVKGRTPTPPVTVNAASYFAWTDAIPTPDLGEDVAMAADGGRVTASSERGGQWRSAYLNDGWLSRGWESGAKKIQGQTLTARFVRNDSMPVSAVIIDPAATAGDPASMDLRGFELWVSNTNQNPSSFIRVLVGSLHLPRRVDGSDALQEFKLAQPVLARYFQLRVVSNNGNPDHVAIAEWEVVASTQGFSHPQSIALDRDGNIYVADTYNHRIQKLGPDGRWLATFGGKGSGPGQFITPDGIAVDNNGNIYVADQGNARVQELSSRGTFVRAWGRGGVGEVQFSEPQDVALGPDGGIYIADANAVTEIDPAGHVVKSLTIAGEPRHIAVDARGNVYATTFTNVLEEFNPDGKRLLRWGQGKPQGIIFQRAEGVAVDGQRDIYVVDSDGDKVIELSARGKIMRIWTPPSNWAWHLPEAIALDGQGDAFVTNDYYAPVVKLSVVAGEPVTSSVWGIPGADTRTLGRPVALTVANDGNVYILDGDHQGVQERDSSGKVLAFIGRGWNTAGGNLEAGSFSQPSALGLDANGGLLVGDWDFIQKINDSGPIGYFVRWQPGKPNFVYGPGAVVRDQSGNVYITNQWHPTGEPPVVEFSPQGKVVRSFGEWGSGLGQFAVPESLALDSHGDIFVTDEGNDQIVELSPGGQPLRAVHSIGAAGDLRFPVGLAIDRDGTIYIGDTGRVLKVSSKWKLLGNWDFAKALTARGVNPQLYDPYGLALDGHGRLYIADTDNSRIVVSTTEGQLLDVWY